jgi:hypothetical protein
MTVPHDTSALADQLGHMPLFQGVAVDVLVRIRGQARSRAVATGESFFHEGDDAEAFFVLTSVRAKLTQLTPEGHQVVLRSPPVWRERARIPARAVGAHGVRIPPPGPERRLLATALPALLVMRAYA